MVPEDPQAYREPKSPCEHGSISSVLYSIHNYLLNGNASHCIYWTRLKTNMSSKP